MLKNRIVACLVIKSGIVVQSIGFKRYLPIGNPSVSVEFLNAWGIDEIIMMDIEATRFKRKPDFAMVTEVSKRNFVPLTVGGGIHNTDDIRDLVHFGADKVSINKEAVKNPLFIEKASKIFGNQCIVVSIDVKLNRKDNYEVFVDSGSTPTGLDPVNWAKEVCALGAGEILLNSIDRDGAKTGYDINIIRSVSSAVTIPVIACGGVGHPQHILEVFRESKVSAAAVGNYFHFMEHSPVIAKAYIRKHKINVRIDTTDKYTGVGFDENGRVEKRSEDYLERLKYEYIPKEVI